MSKALTKQELHNLAMNYVGNDLVDQGFEFISINCKLQKHPQFICIGSDNQYYFIIVNVVKLPFSPYKYDVAWMETFKNQAYSKNAKVLYTGVGFGNADHDDLPVCHDQDYLLEYTGIQSVEIIMN